MTVHVIREVNRCYQGKVEGSLTDIHHCLALLGEPRALKLISQFRAVGGDPGNQAETAYLSSIQQSLFAGELVRCWHTHRPQAAPEQTYLATLLAGVPNWCLWRFAHKEMCIIDGLQKKELIPQQDAERSVMGCSTAEIVLALAERWYFPEIITDALDQRALPSLRFFARAARRGRLEKEPSMPRIDQGRLVNTPALPLVLANALAHEVMVDWYSPQTRRTLAIVAAYLGIDIHLSRQIAQKAALQLAKRKLAPGVMEPAARLIYPPQPPRRRRIKAKDLQAVVDQLQQGVAFSEALKLPEQAERTQTRRIPVSPKPASSKPRPVMPMRAVSPREELLPLEDSPPQHQDSQVTAGREKNYHEAGFVSEERQRLFAQYFQRLNKQIGYYHSDFEVLRDAVDALYHCTRMKRVVGARIDARNGVIKSYFSRGTDDSPGLQDLYLSLQPPNFFTDVCKKPQCHWVSPSQYQQLAQRLPGVFRQAVQVEDFVLGSLFNHEGPFALLYADKGIEAPEPFSSAEFQIVRAVANGCTKHMVAMSRRAGAR